MSRLASTRVWLTDVFIHISLKVLQCAMMRAPRRVLGSDTQGLGLLTEGLYAPPPGEAVCWPLAGRCQGASGFLHSATLDTVQQRKCEKVCRLYLHRTRPGLPLLLPGYNVKLMSSTHWTFLNMNHCLLTSNWLLVVPTHILCVFKNIYI